MNKNYKFLVLTTTVTVLVLSLSAPLFTKELTLKEAIKIAVEKSIRGSIIAGNLEVAEQQYFAKRINFLLPRVSINSSLPSYRENESYRFFGGASQKSLFKNTDFDFSSNIKFEQSLITGGDLTVRANLLRNDATYPNTAVSGTEINELTRQGFFDFNFVQPLLKPSSAKYELKNQKDDLRLAELTNREEVAGLKNEVVEAYLGLLEMELGQKIASDNFESATLRAGIDSIKFSEGVLSEENWLETYSNLLDAELEQFDVKNQHDQRQRELKSLLEIDAKDNIVVNLPLVVENLPLSKQADIINSWENSLPLKKAYYSYMKEKRAADFASSSHGLTGNLEASYSFGRGKVESDTGPANDIETNSWGIALNLTYPIWDGGASGASVKAARLSSEKSRLQYESKQKSIKAELETTVNNINIGFRKLGIFNKKIDLAKNRLNIARERSEDGQISKIEFLKARVFYLEARVNYLKELKKYLIDIHDLEAKYIS